MSSTLDDPRVTADQQSLGKQAAEATDRLGEDEEYEEIGPRRRFLLFAAVPSWVISLLVHLALLLILAYVEFTTGVAKEATLLSVVNPVEGEPVEELLIDPVELEPPIEVETITSSQSVTESALELPSEVTDVVISNDFEAAAIAIDLVEFSEQTAPRNSLMKEIGALTGSGLSGRSAKARAQNVRTGGGTKESEKAVAMALKWLAAHQLSDGSWSFSIGPCECTHKGDAGLRDCFTGATAMALLPFLGSGQTHMEGEYKDLVGRGLAYLVRAEQPNGSLVQGAGSMYAHGLAAIALCEAYAMTHDRKLMTPAQYSLNFISYAQDPIGGGWRYGVRQPGDTSVVGWQLMALKSGHMAYLQVPPNTIAGSVKFLNTVQADGGAQYGYTTPAAGRPATTAVGLLCRMYLGWKKEQPALERGVQLLSARGPDERDMYYNYYATQVMRHYGGDAWTKWNNVMRDQLVKSQVPSGHMAGSWNIPGSNHANDKGGRLYVTSMATMILEVYYRHMPIYGQEAAEEEFPL